MIRLSCIYIFYCSIQYDVFHVFHMCFIYTSKMFSVVKCILCFQKRCTKKTRIPRSGVENWVFSVTVLFEKSKKRICFAFKFSLNTTRPIFRGFVYRELLCNIKKNSNPLIGKYLTCIIISLIYTCRMFIVVKCILCFQKKKVLNKGFVSRF